MSQSAPREKSIGSRSASGAAVPAALGALWFAVGGNFLAFKVALESIPPLLLVSARLALAGAIMLPAAFWLVGPDGRKLTSAQLGGVVVAAFLLLVIGQGAIVTGMQGVNAGPAAVLASSSPLFVVALAWAVGGRRPSAREALGVGLGLLGMLAIAHRGSGGLAFMNVALLLIGAAGWAAGTLWTGARTMPASAAISTALQMLTASAILGVAALVTGEVHAFDPAAVSQRSVVAFGYLVMVGSIVGFGVFVWLARTAPPATANSFQYAAPVVAIALGALIMGERVGPTTLLGCTLALGGVALMFKRTDSRRGTKDTLTERSCTH